MAEMLKLGLVLMLVTLVAAVALGLVNSRTAPIIAEQKELEKQNAMTQVAGSLSPGDSLAFDSISVEGLANPYAVSDNTLEVVRVSIPPDTSRIGYLFIAYGKGYSSTIQTMVAVDMAGQVSGSTILYQQETPGLGANVVDPAKLIDGFSGRPAAGILLVKDGGEIDAMTGCTITSRAVTNSVREGLEAMDQAGLFMTGVPDIPAASEPDPADGSRCDPDQGTDAPDYASSTEGGAE
jgi:Na+-translocating ferredoxin:NAD+ oxidoreductase subunit G